MKRCLGTTGFTLVEVLVALVVFAIGVLGTTAIMVTAVRTNDISKRQTQAIVHAQERVEELRELGYANAGTAAGTHYLDPATQTWAADNDYVSFKRVTTVADNTPAAGMKLVTVSVLWANDVRSVTMQNILAEQ